MGLVPGTQKLFMKLPYNMNKGTGICRKNYGFNRCMGDNGSESVRTFTCETGSGCTPDSNGNEIIGTFADGEKGRVESYEIEKTKESKRN